MPVNSHLPSLIQINNEHYVIPEAGHPMRSRHYDNERKHIVNERVERLERQQRKN